MFQNDANISVRSQASAADDAEIKAHLLTVLSSREIVNFAQKIFSINPFFDIFHNQGT
jgi:hypothetical protein